MIVVSIISHCHGKMVWDLVKQILQFSEVKRIIVTINIDEKVPFFSDSRVFLVINSSPKGFGANHNSAFKRFSSDYFCVLNPDIIFNGNPFPELIKKFHDSNVGLVAPMIINSNDAVEDSLRHFITPRSIIKRVLKYSSDAYSPLEEGADFYPDWVAGMFMLFRSHTYLQINGFDEHYFMYCEDADICTRLWNTNYSIVACPRVKVIHNAQRSSRKSAKHFFWHMTSMVRYIVKHSHSLPKKRISDC